MKEIIQIEKGYPLMTRLFVILLVMSIIACAPINSNARKGVQTAIYNVGYQVLDFKYPKKGEERELTAAVWYPTAAQPKLYNYGGPTMGNIAFNATPLAKGVIYPLLVFSHGYGGSGLGSVFFTEQLAARGWVVVAPDHHDRHSVVRIRTGQKKDFNRRGFLLHAGKIASSSPDDRINYLYRLDEMKLAIDRMLNHPLFGKLIDRNRIALGGHSLGGFTALGLCGTIERRFDPRVKAVLLFSTGSGGYLYRETELARVKIPSMLFMGERERNQLRGSKTMSEVSGKIHRNLSPPKYFLEIKGASHFSFNNRFAENRRARMLIGTKKQFEVIRRYSIAFLEKHVAGKKDADQVLKGRDRMLAQYIRKLTPGQSK
ncbi:MAG: hypothetical protein HKO79_05735 [Desulfobacterales bacterium]|nr:hypothetical protein [Desulfobacterales bacterium]